MQALAIVATVAVTPVLAHHSYASYDTAKLVEIDGVVEDFQLMSPHSLLKVRADDGRVYTFEWLAIAAMQRWRIASDTLHKGDRVMAGGNPRRDFEQSSILNCRSVHRMTDNWSWVAGTRAPQ